MLLHYSVETYSFLIFDFTLAVIYVMKLDTARTYCSHEFRRCLLLENKAMTNLDSLLKTRDTTFPTNICIVKGMVFPVVTHGGCESWTIKKGKC